jgi:hypothetical protein
MLMQNFETKVELDGFSRAVVAVGQVRCERDIFATWRSGYGIACGLPGAFGLGRIVTLVVVARSFRRARWRLRRTGASRLRYRPRYRWWYRLLWR